MLAFGMPGPVELGIIALIIVMLFGVGKLPTVFRDLGESLREFKKGVNKAEDIKHLGD